MTVPSGTRTLVLNDDYSPINVVHWKRGIKRMFENVCKPCHGTGFTDKARTQKCNKCGGAGIIPPAQAVVYYDLWVQDSKGRSYPVPAVIANTHHVQMVRKVLPFSTQRLFRRDNYTCQYCGQQFHPMDLTKDHVVPRSMWKGSDTSTQWKNIVTACRKCNRKKANRTPEQANMPLRKLVNGKWITYKYPKPPSQQELMLITGRTIQPEWLPYLQQLLKNAQPTS